MVMKNLITLFCTSIAIGIFAIPAKAGSTPKLAPELQDQCSTEVKEALYASFLQNRQNEQLKAYDAAKKYLACPTSGVTEAQEKIIDYLNKWTKLYEKAGGKQRLIVDIYEKRDLLDAYRVAKEVFANDPDNLQALVHLGAIAYQVVLLNNPTLNQEGLGYAKKALEALEAGQNLEDWSPLQGRELAIAYLNYSIGALSLEAEPRKALSYLLKSTQAETPLKKSPYTYAYIAGAYETGDYAKLSADYKRDYSGKDETAESKVALANISQLVDRMIDGYARAVALAGNDAQFAKPKAEWMESLNTWYKFRFPDGSLDELIKNILSRPLPPAPTPIK